MLCDQCRTLTGDAWLATPRRLADIEGVDRLKDLLCDRCGELLPPKDSVERFLRSLARLSGFGLAAGGSPILKR